MKKLILSTFAVCLALLSFGQQHDYIEVAKNYKIRVMPKQPLTGAEISYTGTYNPNAVANASRNQKLNVGESTYDLQTNNSVCRRIVNLGNGEVIISYTGSSAGNLAAPDRGTGYNYYNGSSWQHAPGNGYPGRIELDRVGWSNLAVTTSGREIVISHFAGAASTGLNMAYRQVGSGGSWTNFQSFGDPAATWPRMANTGDTAYIVVSRSRADFETFNGLLGGLAFFRTFDAGTTWQGPDSVPGLNSNNFGDLGGDAYAIDCNGATVAFVCGTFQPTLFKSTDAGDNWTMEVIVPIFDNGVPNPTYTGDAGQLLDSVITSDESYTLLVDHNDLVHVWYGRNHIYDDDPGAGWFFFPADAGIMYWNENLAEPELIPNTALPAEQLEQCGYLITNNPDWAQSYFSAIVSMPSAGIDDNGNLYLAYAGLRGAILDATGYPVNFDPLGLMYRNTYALRSNDNGATWLGPYNVSQDTTVEAVFGSLARHVDDSLHILYQADPNPGTAVQDALPGSTQFVTNELIYATVAVTDVVNPPDITCPTISYGGPATINSFQNCDVNLSGFTAFDVPEGNITANIQFDPPVNTSTLGTSTVGAFVLDMAGNSSDTITVSINVVADPTAPMITLVGPGTVDMLLNTSWSDPGFSFDDNGCLDSTNVSDNIDSSVAGTYTVSYYAQDGSGNVSTATRTVNVIGADVDAPVITLNGTDTVIVEACDTSYMDAGATAFDNVDFDVTSGISVSGLGSVDFNTPGSYTITYSVSDNSGNMASEDRVIEVVDNTAPTLTLLGNAVVQHLKDTPYSDAGAEADDCVDGNLDGSITDNISATNPDVATRGTYIIEYDVMDSRGNAAPTLMRTVIVNTEPAADFSFAASGLTFTFTDLSLYDPTAWSWDFGDGSPTSSQKNPVHTFANAGNYNVCLTASNIHGSSPQTCKMVMPSGISEPALNNEVSIYPNPTDGLVTFEFDAAISGEVHIRVFDVLGKAMIVEKTVNINTAENIQLDLSNQPTGVYVVKIETEEGVAVKKLTVE